ncbi:MAG: helix-turn-helix domain-containing protein [Planctomycetes bacterium]|nr:helix-turn-helix domain-containing protein [Planctomycetota bacterium]
MHAKSNPKEIANLFVDPHWAQRFPPILTPDQAAELFQIPKQTIYDWSSRGLLTGCKARVGKHLRLVRDRLIQKFFIEDNNGK